MELMRSAVQMDIDSDIDFDEQGQTDDHYIISVDLNKVVFRQSCRPTHYDPLLSDQVYQEL